MQPSNFQANKIDRQYMSLTDQSTRQCLPTTIKKTSKQENEKRKKNEATDRKVN